MIAESNKGRRVPMTTGKEDNRSSEDEFDRAMQELQAEFSTRLQELEASSEQDEDLTADEVTGSLIAGMLSGLEKMADEDEDFSFDFKMTDVVLEAKFGAAFWAGDDTRTEAVAAEQVDTTESSASVDTRSPEEITWEETAQKLDFIGIDPAVMGKFEDVIPDRYGDIRIGKPGAVDTFLKTDQDPNTETGFDQNTALMAALDAPGRNANDIEKLITAGADATHVHHGYDSVFGHMVNYDHPDTVNADSELAILRLLAAHGADIHHTSPLFGTALQSAIPRGQLEFIKALLEVGADANQLASEDIQYDFLAGVSMLVLAAPRPDVVQLLLDCGADSNRRDDYDVLAADFIGDRIEEYKDERLWDEWTKELAAKLRESQIVIEKAATK